ncbi:MAG: hypothetical protein WA400_15295 [Silvibacterium sp.]
MEIFHHFGFSISGNSERRLFAEAGLELRSEEMRGEELRDGTNPFPSAVGDAVSFEIAENDPRWFDAKRLAGRFRATDTVWTRFSQAELDAADFLRIIPHEPQGDPDAWCDRTSLAKSFDFSRRCQRCGIGRKQVRPFRLRDSPRLTNQLMRLHWVPDEILVAYETWAATFRRLGVQCRPVVLEGSDEVIESVVQLEISEHVGLRSSPADFTVCGLCLRPRSTLSMDGFFPKPVYTDAPVFKSKEYFVSDAGPYSLVFVSKVMYTTLKIAGVRGMDFYPCRR